MFNYGRLRQKVRGYLQRESAKKGLFSIFLSERLFAPQLWKWRREGVARGTGFGLMYSIAPIPMQSIWGAVTCLWVRGNIPMSVLSAWMTPPGAIVIATPLQWWFGAWLFDLVHLPGSGLEYEKMHAFVHELDSQFSWLTVERFCDGVNPWLVVSELGVGVIISCLLLGLVGYFGTHVIWMLCSSIKHWLGDHKVKKKAQRLKSFKQKSPL